MKIAFLFQGYGSQFVGMAKELYDESRIVQEYFEEASNCLNVNFVKLCFASSEHELGTVEHAYNSVFLVSAALSALLKQEGIQPTVVAGQNIGQVSAIHSAGGLSFPDGLYFLAKYAHFYQELLTQVHDLQALEVEGIAYKKVVGLCEAVGEGANCITARLADNAFIVTAAKNNITALQKVIKEQMPAVAVHKSPLERGLFSAFMQPVIEQVSVYVQKIDFQDTLIPFLPLVHGKPTTSGVAIKDLLLQSFCQQARWDNVVKSLVDAELLLQIGPGTKLATFMQAIYPEKRIMSVNTSQDIKAVQKLLATAQQP